MADEEDEVPEKVDVDLDGVHQVAPEEDDVDAVSGSSRLKSCKRPRQGREKQREKQVEGRDLWREEPAGERGECLLNGREEDGGRERRWDRERRARK